MIDPLLAQVLTTTITYGLCGSLAAVAVWFLNRDKQNPGPRVDQAAATGFLVGAGFGAFFGMFQTLLIR